VGILATKLVRILKSHPMTILYEGVSIQVGRLGRMKYIRDLAIGIFKVLSV
jgi:hypothetical protein